MKRRERKKKPKQRAKGTVWLNARTRSTFGMCLHQPCTLARGEFFGVKSTFRNASTTTTTTIVIWCVYIFHHHFAPIWRFVYRMYNSCIPGDLFLWDLCVRPVVIYNIYRFREHVRHLFMNNGVIAGNLDSYNSDLSTLQLHETHFLPSFQRMRYFFFVMTLLVLPHSRWSMSYLLSWFIV